MFSVKFIKSAMITKTFVKQMMLSDVADEIARYIEVLRELRQHQPSLKLNENHEAKFIHLFFNALMKKGKGTVLSPHPVSELCSANADSIKYLPWSLVIFAIHIYPSGSGSGYPLQLPWSIQLLTRNLGVMA